MHFYYGMREAPAISLRDRGLPGCDPLIGREQLVKAVEQLAQAEFDHEDRAALEAGHLPVREPAGLAISISGCSARNARSRGTWPSLGGGTMSITAQYLATAVIGVKGTNLTSWPESSRVPGYPRANTLQEDSLADSLERDASGPGKRSAAGTAGRRPQAWNRCAGHC